MLTICTSVVKVGAESAVKARHASRAPLSCSLLPLLVLLEHEFPPFPIDHAAQDAREVIGKRDALIGRDQSRPPAAVFRSTRGFPWKLANGGIGFQASSAVPLS